MLASLRTSIQLEKLLEKAGPSKYKLVVLAARRALELSGGSPKLTEIESKTKPSIIALKEISEGRVSYKLKKLGKEKEKDKG